MPAHKRHIILGLLLTGFVLWLIYPLYYSVAIEKRRHIQQLRIRTNRQDAAYSDIFLTAAEFKKYYNRADKELDIEGEMYDVVRIREDGGNFYCTALKDKKESGLSNALSSTIKHKKNSKDNPGSYWLPIVYCDWPEQKEIPRFRFSIEPFGPTQKYYLPLGYVKKQKRPPRASFIEITERRRSYLT